MSIQRYEEPAPPREWIALLPAAAELARAVADTDFVPAALRGNAAAITAAVLYGDEVGLKPMQSLAHISVIEGRPSMSSEIMRGLVLAAGHELWLEEATNTRVTVAGRRRDSDQTSRVTWTMDDAKRANLVGKLNWRKYPRQMLVARATADLCRAVFADAVGGLAATEELEDAGGVDVGASAGEPTPEAGTTRRRRRATLAPVTAPAEPQAPTPAPVPPLPGEETASVSDPSHTTVGAGLGDEAPAPADVEAPDGTEGGSAASSQHEASASSSPPSGTLVDDENHSLRIRLMATYRERGFSEREARLAFAQFVTGRQVESANDLTPDEAVRIIDALDAHAAGNS